MRIIALTVVRDADGSSVSAGKQPLAHLLQGVPSSQDDLLSLARAICCRHGLLDVIRAHLVYGAQIGHVLLIDQHALKVVDDVPLGFLLLSLPLLLLLFIPLVGTIQGLDEAQVILRLVVPTHLAEHHPADVLAVGVLHLPAVVTGEHDVAHARGQMGLVTSDTKYLLQDGHDTHFSNAQAV